MTEFLPIELYAFIYHSIFESDSAVYQIVISYDLIFTLFIKFYTFKLYI